MNNIFDIKRFCRYALMNYSNDKLKYIGLAIGVAFIVAANCCGFRWQYQTGVFDADDMLTGFSSGFFIAVLFPSLAIVELSLGGYKSSSLSMRDIMLPVSSFERYLFALLNSVVVSALIGLFVFMCVSNLVESMFYFDDAGNYIFTGWVDFGKHTIGSEYHHAEIFSLKILTEEMFRPLYIGKVPMISLIYVQICNYLFYISILMWGRITFGKKGGIRSLVLHIVLLVLAAFIVTGTLALIDLKPAGYDLFVHGYSSLGENPILQCALYSLIVPFIVYQWVIWKKIKTISLTK